VYKDNLIESIEIMGGKGTRSFLTKRYYFKF
jgi:hypothetical protein